MNISTFSLYSYEISLKNGKVRSGLLLKLTDENGREGWGEIAPLPGRSLETVEDAVLQIHEKKEALLETDRNIDTCLERLRQLRLFPSVEFGWETALLSLLDPLPEHTMTTAAFLTGSVEEMLREAEIRKKEGYSHAKVKVGHLSLTEAESVLNTLVPMFRLRVDVNKAWDTEEALRLFSKFPRDAFDYVEEPLQNPRDLFRFSHPLAIDESFSEELLLRSELLPMLHAVIYKPTMLGGLSAALPLLTRLRQKGISLILSSSFESDIGLSGIVSLGHRLSLQDPVGIGTHSLLQDHIGSSFRCTGPLCSVSGPVAPSNTLRNPPYFLIYSFPHPTQ